MRSRILSLSGLVFVAACSSQPNTPATVSSAGQSAYAVHYADEVTAATKSANDAQARAKTLSGGFAVYVDQLKKPGWERVEKVVSASDAAGKSADFAEAQNDATAIRSFWEGDKNEINSRVIGGAQAKLKESGCNGDVAGPIAYSMNEAINKQLQKRLRSKNDAFTTIERNKIALGPQNVSVLEKLADDVSEASYDVHVLMPLQRTRLQRLAADRDDVKKTLDRYVADENAFQAEPGRTDPEKKASADRITAANKAKADVESAASQADALLKDMEKANAAATKEYERALEDLQSKIAEKKKAEPAREPGKT